MWGAKRRGERRHQRALELMEEQLVARSRELFHDANASLSGSPVRNDLELRDEMMTLMARASQLFYTSNWAPLIILNLAIPSIRMGSAVRDWKLVAVSGFLLAGACSVVRHRQDGVDAQLEREFAKYAGATFDEALYATAQLPEGALFGRLCEILLGGGFAGRELLQTAAPDVRQAWDYATGIIANGGATLSDDEYHARIAAGAWLSSRQRVEQDPEALVDVMTRWMEEELATVSMMPVTGLSFDGDATAAWQAVLKALDHTSSLERHSWLSVSTAAGCTSPLVARESRTDLVYLVAGESGGAAIRYSGGENYRLAPEVVQLPGVGLAWVRELAARLVEVRETRPSDLAGRSALIDEVRCAIGEYIAKPLLQRWPQMGAVVFIPVGEIQQLPLTTALVGGVRLNARLDMTVAPSASSVFVALGSGVSISSDRAVVMADPANGEIHLPWVAVEAVEVAAVYSGEPDLLVDFGPQHARSGPSERALLEDPPAFNTDVEHVLAHLEETRIIHLACHGSVPAGSGLPILFLSGRLAFDALEHHRLADGAVVVLSACSVGASIRDAPFARLGFPSMLLAVGASEVVAPSEPLIDCRETVDFMVQLHRGLRAGLSASSALRAAMDDAEACGVGSAVWGSIQVHGVRPEAPGRQ